MAITLNNRALVTIYGGSGFIGRHVVRAIAKTGARMRIAVRRPELAGHLQPLGGVGQINAVQANVRFPEFAARGRRRRRCRRQPGRHLVSVRQADLQIGAGRGRAPCRRGGAAAAGARALVHVSAIGASADAPSVYARSKAAGERAVQSGLCRRRHSAAVHRVRAGGRFLQPLCGARAHRAGTAADRRRQDAIAAGVRRRRGQGGDRRPHRQDRCPARLTSWAGPRC